jgi:hypothetical protein
MVRAKLLNSPFVILHHTSHFSKDRGDHWDWLIRFPQNFLAELAPRMQAKDDEQSLSLLSFASETDPRDWTCATRFWRLAPHRLKYLDYQGEVSGGRGFVKRIATGELQWTFLNDFELGFRLFRLGWLEDSPPNAERCVGSRTIGGDFHRFLARTILSEIGCGRGARP